MDKRILLSRAVVKLLHDKAEMFRAGMASKIRCLTIIDGVIIFTEDGMVYTVDNEKRRIYKILLKPLEDIISNTVKDGDNDSFFSIINAMITVEEFERSDK